MRRYAVFSAAVVAALLGSSELALSLPILGLGPDLVIVVVAIFSLGQRPRTAATAAFVAGLLRDLLLGTPRGLSAFAYAITAYGVASVGIVRGAWQLIGTVVGATFVSQVLYGFGAVFLGPQVDASPLLRMVLVTSAYNALLAPLLMPLLRRVIPTEVTAKVAD